MKSLVGSLIIIFSLLFVCCTNRSALTPHEALIGHWVEEMGDNEYYFSKDKFTLVEKGVRRDPVGYIVIYNNPPHSMAIRRIADKEKLSEEAKKVDEVVSNEDILAFEKDKMTALVESQIIIAGSRSPLSRKLWRYKDGRQHP